MIIPPLAVLILCLAVFFLVEHSLRVKEIVFIGNHHLKNEELSAICRIRKNSGLFDTSGRNIYQGLKASPWIKDAVIRKELSGRVLIKVTEREPVALLSLNGTLFLIDNEGFRLEPLKEGTVQLLPVIKDIDPVANPETYAGAVRFVDVLRSKGISSNEGDAEITGLRPEDLTLRVDKIDIKVGIGDFENKLAKLAFVRDEIQKRNMNVESIDLRFANKVIVKPVRQVSAGAGSDPVVRPPETHIYGKKKKK